MSDAATATAGASSAAPAATSQAKAAKKKAAAAKPKKAADHPKYAAMIRDALSALKVSSAKIFTFLGWHLDLNIRE